MKKKQCLETFTAPPGLQRSPDRCGVVVGVGVAEWVPASFL